jgi:hypothetical protein
MRNFKIITGFLFYFSRLGVILLVSGRESTRLKSFAVDFRRFFERTGGVYVKFG